MLEDLSTAIPKACPLALGLHTTDLEVAKGWMEHLAAVGVERIIAKRLGEPYRPGERGWLKVKSTPPPKRSLSLDH